ncbi:MAG: hypothetical protein ACRD6R_08405 [Candidatus Polarisedimenticolia bacterium]
MERAIFAALGSLARDQAARAADLVKVRRTRDRLTLRADPRRLREDKVPIEWSDDALRFRRSRVQAVVPITHFRARTSLHEQLLLIELTRRVARDRRPSREDAASRAPREAREAVAGVVEALGGAARSRFLTRALNALSRLSREVPASTLAAASAAPTDYRALVRALQDPAVVQEVGKVDPLGPARIRGLEARERLLEWGGGTLTAAEAARLLRISRQAVDKRRRAGKLLGLTVGRRGYAYPSWQFSDGGALPGLETVLETLRRHDPWMQMGFMLNKNDWLDGRIPLEELRRGRVDAVVDAARAYGEQGAP